MQSEAFIGFFVLSDFLITLVIALRDYVGHQLKNYGFNCCAADFLLLSFHGMLLSVLV